MTPKPTLKTISQLSGLAVPTVSRALNDAPDIGSKTKALVRQIANEIGYVPNRAGVRLRTGRTNVISLVLSTEHEMMNHTAKLITALAGGLNDTPFHMIMTPYFPHEDPMKPIRYIVETGSADAVVFNQIRPADPRVKYLMDRGFPFATHGRCKWSDKHAWFDYDNESYARFAVQELHRRGRKRLILIAPPQDQNYSIEMIRGATEAARECGIHLEVAKDVTSDGLVTEVRSKVAAIVAADPTIDGLITASANATMAAVAGMESEGFDVGLDIDVVAKEAIAFLTYFRSKIIVLNEDITLAGSFLAKAAIQAIRAPDDPPMQMLQVPEPFPR
ncbi:LacI family transcriptional regulator [Flavimaricola marinus]|uniref:LacI family transcriptional regulator n=1 Tax=Flavimaricola marinus TaxID=1819565 RepID=UPI001FE85446|nr:LacI family transcriptional regulator [Flavimaricola marinus]